MAVVLVLVAIVAVVVVVAVVVDVVMVAVLVTVDVVADVVAAAVGHLPLVRVVVAFAIVVPHHIVSCSNSALIVDSVSWLAERA